MADYLIRGLDPGIRESVRKRLKVQASKEGLNTGELAARLILLGLDRLDAQPQSAGAVDPADGIGTD